MKKSELKEFIKGEIINELSAANENAAEEIKDTEELTKAVQDLAKAKEEAGLNENINPEVTKLVNRFIGGLAKRYDYDTQSAVNAIMMVLRSQGWEGIEEGLKEANIGLADLEEMGFEDGVKAWEMASTNKFFTNKPDLEAYKKGFIQGFIDGADSTLFEGYEEQGFESEDEMEDYYLNLDSVDENESLDEMAKIVGDLKSSIEKVIQSNPELETKELKKTIKTDADVIKALGDNKLFDTQLGKYIAVARGERTIGKRGRKADPNAAKKPKSPTGRRGRPAKSKTEKDKESKTVSSKLNKSVTTVKGEEPTAKDVKQAIGFEKKGKKDLQLQEKRKMVKSFISDMKKQGIVSQNGKVEDKEKYDAAWAIAKPEIDAAVKNIR